jgi:formate--tetrahydrofolate ligase
MNLPATSLLDAAARLGLGPADLSPFGDDKAKLRPGRLLRPRHSEQAPKLVLVSAITPTPAGEGKTTTTIGLGDALTRLGERTALALREPSLGPCFGVKGGGTGGGKAMLHPSADINLHFTGDFHAITAAHNLLAAAVDNHLHFGTDLDLDPRRVVWPRVMDMNDRALRSLVSGLGGASDGVPREASFDITAASEIMAILCLAADEADLRARIERIIVGYSRAGAPVTAKQVGVVGAMMALLRDAQHPNLVQSLGGTPAFVHGGPFANIAHGCNSLAATRAAMHFADWVLTEAGFAFDLGGEKFLDIKAQVGGLPVAAVVLVATVRALKMHGGVELSALGQPDAAAVERGLPNLARHLDSVAVYGLPALVVANRHSADTEAELAVIAAYCAARGVPFAAATHFAEGGAGAEEAARRLREIARPTAVIPVQAPGMTVVERLDAIATRLYGAARVELGPAAKAALRSLQRQGLDRLPVCVAKTQSSLSDDPRRRGRPEGFTLTVRDLRVNAGAGFIVALAGDIVRMPGLPARPAAVGIDLVAGEIQGLS